MFLFDEGCDGNCENSCLCQTGMFPCSQKFIYIYGGEENVRHLYSLVSARCVSYMQHSAHRRENINVLNFLHSNICPVECAIHVKRPVPHFYWRNISSIKWVSYGLLVRGNIENCHGFSVRNCEIGSMCNIVVDEYQFLEIGNLGN